MKRVRQWKIKYVKLIDVLGDVGGLMEIILSLFKIVSIFLTDLLYEKSLIKLVKITIIKKRRK